MQAYVRDPVSAGEPPEQLRAFTRVVLAPNSRRNVTMAIPLSSLNVYVRGELVLENGGYSISVGQSADNLPISMQVQLT